mmetsp:Transcript_12028/g.38448  ORF Transcript_12028/g.38448 Transcript_12028/m.38448 type:complete len:163 (+) Transcript_12028:14-502(+)
MTSVHAVRVEENERFGKHIVATRTIVPGDTVLECRYEAEALKDEPSMHTVQISAKQHCLVSNDMEFTAHACDPSCHLVLDAGACRLVALRQLEPGDLVSFDYCTTEWDVLCPFDCGCGAPQCVGRVRGFRHLTAERAKQLAPVAQQWMVELREAMSEEAAHK